MKKIKNWLRAVAETRFTCPNGHMSVIQRPDGILVCMDCGWTSG